MARRVTLAACIFTIISASPNPAHAQIKDEIVFQDHRSIALIFTPDGKTLITATQAKEIFGPAIVSLFDVPTWKKAHSLEMPGMVMRSIALSPNGKKLAIGGHGPDIMGSAPPGLGQIWDLTGVKPKRERALTGHYNQFSPVAFSADSRTIALGGSLIEVRTWQERSKNFPGGLFSPDGKLAASGGSGTHIFDLTTMKPDGELSMGRPGHIRCLAFSPDAKTLASGGGGLNDPELTLWDMATRKPRVALKGHDDMITCVAISCDGKTLASGSQDKTVRVWDLETGKLLSALRGHTGSIVAVAFHPSGSMLLSAAEDKTVRQWRLPR